MPTGQGHAGTLCTYVAPGFHKLMTGAGFEKVSDVARVSGISLQTIVGYAKGKRQMGALSTLMCLSSVFGVTLHELVNLINEDFNLSVLQNGQNSHSIYDTNTKFGMTGNNPQQNQGFVQTHASLPPLLMLFDSHPFSHKPFYGWIFGTLEATLKCPIINVIRWSPEWSLPTVHAAGGMMCP
jgi:hypothetical protein